MTRQEPGEPCGSILSPRECVGTTRTRNPWRLTSQMFVPDFVFEDSGPVVVELFFVGRVDGYVVEGATILEHFAYVEEGFIPAGQLSISLSHVDPEG